MKKDTLTIRFLYKTVIGRWILKILTQPLLSKYIGMFLDSRLSAWIVPLFIRKHRIDMSPYNGTKYPSFNAFFTRKRNENPLDARPECLISPCDGYLSIYPISEHQIYHIKHIEYHLDRLLESKKLAKQFSGGICMIFRLTPQDYHHYCYVCDGIGMKSKIIKGRLHCVRPTAYTSCPVFTENSREFDEIRTQYYGNVIQMEIGALLVGKIHNYSNKKRIIKGEEKGYFEFGGSTIIVLVERERLRVDERIVDNMRRGLETKVSLGESVGVLQKRMNLPNSHI